MAAQVEEVVVHADAWDGEHIGPDLDELLLDRASRRDVGGTGIGRGKLRWRKRLAIELAVGRERQTIQNDERGGNHVLRQAATQALPQFGDFGRRTRGILARNHVRDQQLIAGPILARHHRGLTDRRTFGENCFDLVQLDAEATNLDLVIPSSEELDVAIGQPARRGRRSCRVGRPEDG